MENLFLGVDEYFIIVVIILLISIMDYGVIIVILNKRGGVGMYGM